MNGESTTGSHLRMYTQVLPTRQTKARKRALLLALLVRLRLLDTVFHQALQLGEGLLDLGDGSRAVDELALGGVEL